MQHYFDFIVIIVSKRCFQCENMRDSTSPCTAKVEAQAPEDDPPSPPIAPTEEYYCFTMGNNQLYSFLRLHHLLLTRLFQLQARAQVMQQEYREETRSSEQVANILSLRKKGLYCIHYCRFFQVSCDSTLGQQHGWHSFDAL